MQDKPLNLDSALKERKERAGKGEKVKDRIYLIGIELEGGWQSLPEGTRLVHDGSVVITAPPGPGVLGVLNPNQVQALEVVARRMAAGLITFTTARRQAAEAGFDEMQLVEYIRTRGNAIPNLMTGEVPSPPMPPTQLSEWMRKFYPNQVNQTCGLHVHQSFKSALHYSRLMTPAYPATIVKYVERWAKEESLPADHPIWHRLAGRSDYCQHKFYADQQVLATEKSHDRQRHGHRYTAISYPWSRHGTIECRLLPMMESCEQGIRAVQHVLDITNTFLLSSAKKEDTLRQQVVGEEGEQGVLMIDETGRRRRHVQ